MALTRAVVALYHFPCPDGITAALACHLFHLQKGIKIEFFPHTTYNTLDIDDLTIKSTDTIYLLDYCGPAGYAISLAQRAARCVVLDHHKTAFEHLSAENHQLPPNLEVNMHMHRSGATIALDYFQPLEGITPDTIQFFKHIEDGDLWQWKLPGSKAFYAGLTALKLDYNVQSNPQIFDQLLALSTTELIAAGQVALEREREFIEAALQRAFVIDLGGRQKNSEEGWGQALAVEIDSDFASIRSQLGNALAVKASSQEQGLKWGWGAVIYREKEMENNDNRSTDVKVSLRSVAGSGMDDTTVVSQVFGGGGHRNASAFLIDEGEFKRNWKV